MSLINIKALYVFDSHVRRINGTLFQTNIRDASPAGETVNSDEEEMFVISLFMCIMSSKSR